MKEALLHLVALASVLSIVASQTTYDCNVGCSLDASLMGPPVCGDDNLTYLNECLAVCQNITVASLGVCEGEDPFQESFVSSDPQVIPMSTMTRFSDYRFVGKRLPSTNFEEDIRYLLEEQMINETDDGFLEEMDDQFIPNYRFTPEGYEYRTTLMFEEESLLQPVAPQLGLLGENGLDDDGEGNATRRELVLIGQDSRVPVADTTRYPFRTIANADYWWGEGGCTLTLISRTSALTAGHCVWNTNRKGPMNMTAIAPARFRDATKRDGTAEPFGTWEVDYVSLFGNFQQLGQTNFDIAVVTYKPRIRNNLSTCKELYPGDALGHIGLDRPAEVDGRVVDSRLNTMVITGYPYDYNRQMATSGPCDRAPESRRANYINHYCDTVGGNSGSSVIVEGNIALGVHTHGVQTATTSMNGAVMMTTRLYASIYEWAGHGKGQSLCSRTEVLSPVVQPVAPPVQKPVSAPQRQPSPGLSPIVLQAPTPSQVTGPTRETEPAPVSQPVKVISPIVLPVAAPQPAPVAQPVKVISPIVLPAPVPQIVPVPSPVLLPPPVSEIVPVPRPVVPPAPVPQAAPVAIPVALPAPVPEIIPVPRPVVPPATVPQALPVGSPVTSPTFVGPTADILPTQPVRNPTNPVAAPVSQPYSGKGKGGKKKKQKKYSSSSKKSSSGKGGKKRRLM
ncbi:hypothetical protein FisN_9Hh367 [Fistulifera solaris]|uniref:Serine protease n=1 Tax=Fistulifera solaris TaxID=1519565 RepID=A0A1Z5KCT7_FISSO|nr:hypothetical protein FisN_9Hh367 [Fistulifera solaris]|eukprot:GAX24114.1 hypothetical protein FisN_9Hh367 [Fistulifera solaris]